MWVMSGHEGGKVHRFENLHDPFTDLFMGDPTFGFHGDRRQFTDQSKIAFENN